MDRLNQLNLQVEPVSANIFSHVTMAPPDPILGTAQAFQKDKSTDKINLGIGAYRDGDGKPYVFKAVKEAEEIVRKGNHNKVHLFISRNISQSRAYLPSAPEPGTLFSGQIPQPSKKKELPLRNRSQALEVFPWVSIS